MTRQAEPNRNAARRRVNNSTYYERHRDEIRERRRARYWREREAKLAARSGKTKGAA
jgi:hypothetical protein